MSLTLLQLVQTASNELGLSSPTTVIGNTSSDIIQMKSLLNATLRQLSRKYDWQYLSTEYRFTTQYTTTTGTWTTAAATITSIPDTTGLDTTYMVIGTGIPNDTYILSVDSATQVTISQTPTAAGTAAAVTFGKTKYALPADYDRQVSRTQYDKSKRWEMLGPETPQLWQWLKSAFISTGPRIRYRIMGNTLQVWPAPSTAEYIGFEYISSYTVLATGGTAPTKSSFTVDTDTCIWPDELMILALKLKYFEIKGFDTTAFYRDYLEQLEIAKATDQPRPMLSMSPRPANVLIGWDNIPDSGYGG